jgi:hypothetical protein
MIGKKLGRGLHPEGSGQCRLNQHGKGLNGKQPHFIVFSGRQEKHRPPEGLCTYLVVINADQDVFPRHKFCRVWEEGRGRCRGEDAEVKAIS